MLWLIFLSYFYFYWLLTVHTNKNKGIEIKITGQLKFLGLLSCLTHHWRTYLEISLGPSGPVQGLLSCPHSAWSAIHSTEALVLIWDTGNTLPCLSQNRMMHWEVHLGLSGPHPATPELTTAAGLWPGKPKLCAVLSIPWGDFDALLVDWKAPTQQSQVAGAIW